MRYLEEEAAILDEACATGVFSNFFEADGVHDPESPASCYFEARELLHVAGGRSRRVDE